MSKCDYGCGRNAIKTFTNGKKCCSSIVSKCPSSRAKVGAAMAQRHYAGDPSVSGFAKGNQPWNKGATSETDKTVALIAKKTRRTKRTNFEARGFTIGSSHSTTTRRKISMSCKGVTGGYREGSGRGIKGTYSGIYCDSSWELAFVLWCEIHSIPIKRAKKTFPYSWLGETHRYLPDFRVKRNNKWSYVEVKGWSSKQWEAKASAFPYKLEIIDSKRIKKILAEVVAIYGKDFIGLYD